MDSLYDFFVFSDTLFNILCVLFSDIYLPLAAEGRGQEIIKCLLYVHACVSVCESASVHLSRFYINLNISFICKDILTKFARNVYGYKNLSVQNFGLILKNKMATIANCLKIIGALNLVIFQLASPNLHKSYMAGTASLILILA